MIHPAKFAHLLVGLLAIPLAASAQTRVAPVRPIRVPVPMAHPNAAGRNAFAPTATPTRPRIIRLPAAPVAEGTGSSSSQMVSTPNIAVFPNGTNGFIFPGATSFDIGQLLNNGAPGLGFDYTHLAALTGNLGERAFIDPVTQQDIALAEQLARSARGFAGGFIPFWGAYGDSEPSEEQPLPQQQPQVIILQQPVPATGSATASSPEATPAAQQPPPSDVGEFTLVLRDGGKIKAVAFTRQSDQIVYITKDGVRDSFAAADLDIAATEQLNQNHGTPLHLSL